MFAAAPSLLQALLDPLQSLPTVDFVRLCCTCSTLQAFLGNSMYWSRRCFEDFKILNPQDPRNVYLEHYKKFFCNQCKNRFKIPCTCLVRRKKFSLTISCFNSARTGNDGYISKFEGFAVFRERLAQFFSVQFFDTEKLSEELLRKTDIFIVNMTAAVQTLTKEENGLLQKFIQNGGTAILNGFSNWDNSGDFAASIVGFLGIHPIPRATYGAYTESQISSEFFSLEEGHPLQLLLNGPFGMVKTFANNGETEFTVKPFATRIGAVQLTPRVVYFPRNSFGKGQVLMFTNFHCLAGPMVWRGGTFQVKDNAALILNFCALACKIQE